MTESWRPRTVELRCQLGNWSLWRATFPGKVFQVPCNWLFDNPPRQPTLPPLDNQTQVAVLLAAPIPEEYPTLDYSGNSFRYTSGRYRRFFAQLNGTFEDYLRHFSAKSRSTLRRKVRKFADYCEGKLRMVVAQHPEDMASFHQLARQVAEKTYQEKLYQMGLPGDDGQREYLEKLASEDRIRGFLLCHGNRPVAYMTFPIVGDVLLYDFLGYDPEYAAWSPGTVLQFLALEHLFAEKRFRWLDFDRGEGQHKEVFATTSHLCADIYHFQPSLKHRMLVQLHRSCASMTGATAYYANATGLRSLGRRIFRTMTRKGLTALANPR